MCEVCRVKTQQVCDTLSLKIDVGCSIKIEGVGCSIKIEDVGYSIKIENVGYSIKIELLVVL